MFEDYLEGVKTDLVSSTKYNSLGRVMQPLWDDQTEAWKQMDIVIVGIPEGRETGKNHGSRLAPDAVRKELYGLSVPQSKIKIGDLGNIMPGSDFKDTEIALKQILTEVLKEGVLPIVLGGGTALTYAQYQAFEPVLKSMEVTLLAPFFELEEDNFLSQICLHQPNYLFNLNVLGYQSYYVEATALQTLEKMYFNPIRLGVLRNNLQESEPILRNTNLFCVDIGVVKQADAPANYYNNPNGLSSEEICQLCWYAGVSDSLKSFGLYEINPEFDYRNQTSKLASQMIWYFIDGYYNRKGDVPGMHQEFLKYRCTLNGNKHDVIFYKSKLSERWWMQVNEENGEDNSVLVPCSYADYQMATQGDMPDRFWKALQKL